jgi:AcrR family transcriptional regulator
MSMGRHPIATEKAVLDAAVRVISRRGLAKLTLADVAAEAGLAAPTLIQRFGSKRGLLLAISRQSASGVRAAFTTARKVHDSPLEALLNALAGMTAPIRTPGEIANHLSFLQLDLTDPEFRDLAQAHSREFRENIATLLREAVAAGEILACDTEQLAWSVQIAFSGVLVQWAIDGAGSLAETLQAEMRRLFAVAKKPSEDGTRVCDSEPPPSH